MFRSMSRAALSVAFVLALVLSSVPVQAQPLDAGARLVSFDASWLEAAMSWFQGLLTGDGAESPSFATEAATIKGGGTSEIPDSEAMSGSCIDPMGGCWDIIP